jgi:hypothetical protein
MLMNYCSAEPDFTSSEVDVRPLQPQGFRYP